MKRLSMMIMVLTLMTIGMAMAEPSNALYYESPQPTGGVEALKKMIDYPTLAREAGIEGQVVLQFRVSTDGSIEDLKVIKSGGHILDAAATAGIGSVRWEPAHYGNQPVEAIYQLPVEFRTSTR